MGDVFEFPPRKLPALTGGLAAKSPSGPPGSIFVYGSGGGFAAPPLERLQVRFGRHADEVEVCVGSDDGQISRQHGRIVCAGRQWWLHNDGRRPIRLPNSADLLLPGRHMVLAKGYSPLFIDGSADRQHLLEVRVVGLSKQVPLSSADEATSAPPVYELSEVERLVLTALAQRYLRQEPHPQPVAWQQVADDLNATPGQEGWHWHRASNIADAVRKRVSAQGVRGLTREEVGEPVGNKLKDNLIHELLQTATLLPLDLALLGDLDF
ncbi:FHA domain-containing protein [Actinophytocola sp.]|uniref:FHA domain-containing protein n=1 Tax=Actinophytocola sp. TaxID=1872138 RepID=UPI0025BDAA89|nr:FHA domain-containing protein [Actinophytocola sp.]